MSRLLHSMRPAPKRLPSASISRRSRAEIFLTLLALWTSAFLTAAAQPAARVQSADLLPGADLGAKIAAADRLLGAGPGVITVTAPGALRTPVDMGVGHSLLLNAKVTWSATVTLSQANEVSCGGGGSVASTLPAGVALFAAAGARNVAIHNCAIVMANVGPVLAGSSLAQLSVHHLSVTGGSIAQISAEHGGDPGGTSTDLTFHHNTVTDAPNTGGAAILLVNTIGATIDSNSFTGISTGTQWWGGDSAFGNLSQVTRTGKLTLQGNHCIRVTACLWGSMGYDINVTGNTADGCADVCFDTEGGLNTVFSRNTATACGNGCGAIFFFSRGISFTENTFSGDAKGGGLFFIKNKSADPITHSGLTVSKNTLTCASTCNAFFQEAVSQALFEGNTVTNGVFAPAGFGQNITIARNQFTFTRALAPDSAVINGPSITGGTTLTIEGNSVSSSVPQGARSACINAVWNDFNNTDTYVIANNRCLGPAPFPVDIATTTAGMNPGPHAIWRLKGNVVSAGNIVHKRTTANEVYVLDPK